MHHLSKVATVRCPVKAESRGQNHCKLVPNMHGVHIGIHIQLHVHIKLLAVSNDAGHC